MRPTMTITALTAALLISTSAYAANVEVSTEATIDSLPEKGAVSLMGTVDRVVDNDTFILRDTSGDTIDVHTSANYEANVGDMVSVKGDKTAEIAGMGEEIKNASVSVTDALGDTMASVTETATGSLAAVTNGAALDNNTKARVAMKNEDNTKSPKAARDNTDSKKTAAFDLDVDADADVDKVADAGDASAQTTLQANAETPRNAKNNTKGKNTAAYEMDVDVEADASKIADAGEMTAKEATAKADAAGKRVMAHADATTNKASEALMGSTIKSLPKKGMVELNGIVAKVDNENSFTLRDSEGKTIDVHTASNVNVQPGDTVNVNGNVKSELLGFGREIESAKVLVVSDAQ
ncbi:MAG: hypothetical protein MK052_02080 [Alphaproteobacteria bacterium]|nr:hypothetical protein [Alphaproteobacteria bacterium]